MKRFALTILLSLSPLAVSHAADSVTFVGSFMERGAIAVRFDETVPKGQKRTMQLPEGQVVEMSVDASGQAQVRLLDPAGKELHAATGTVDGTGSQEFMYALCRGGAFAYTSPPQKGKSGCP